MKRYPTIILQNYLRAGGPPESDHLLSELLSTVARPVIQRVVHARLALSPATREDAEDACAEAVLSLIERLRALRGSGTEIRDFESYVAGIAAHAAYEFFGRRFPERRRMRYRLRYLLTADQRFRLGQSAQGVWQGSLARGSGPPADSPAIEACSRELASSMLPAALPDLVYLVLKKLGGPVELNELTSLLARLTGSADLPAVDIVRDDTLVDTQPGPADQAELRDWLAWVWREIRELPEPQRIALLLGMRSAQGSAAWLVADLGIASLRELAAQMGVSHAELAEIWNRLPLEDREIARRLGLERQQVVNLRSSARQRLERKMKPRGNTTGTSTTQ